MAWGLVLGFALAAGCGERGGPAPATPDRSFADPVSELRAKLGAEGRVDLTWLAHPATAVTAYAVYRQETVAFALAGDAVPATAPVAVATTASTAAVDRLPHTGRFRYTVAGVLADGNRTFAAAPVTVVYGLPGSDAAFADDGTSPAPAQPGPPDLPEGDQPPADGAVPVTPFACPELVDWFQPAGGFCRDELRYDDPGTGPEIARRLATYRIPVTGLEVVEASLVPAELVQEIEFDGAGEDGIWGTDDDDVQRRTKVAYDGLDRVVTATTYTGAGPDGCWGTGDDEIEQYTTFGYSGPISLATAEVFGTPGLDYAWKTGDDGIIRRSASLSDANGDVTLATVYTSPGSDGTWGTGDDHIDNYARIDYRATAEPVTAEDYVDPGTDGTFFTADDIPAFVIEITYGTNSRPVTVYTHSVTTGSGLERRTIVASDASAQVTRTSRKLPGPDEQLGTADDVTFETGIGYACP